MGDQKTLRDKVYKNISSTGNNPDSTMKALKIVENDPDRQEMWRDKRNRENSKGFVGPPQSSANLAENVANTKDRNTWKNAKINRTIIRNKGKANG